MPGVVDVLTAEHLQEANFFHTEMFLAKDEVLHFCCLVKKPSCPQLKASLTSLEGKPCGGGITPEFLFSDLLLPLSS